MSCCRSCLGIILLLHSETKYSDLWHILKISFFKKKKQRKIAENKIGWDILGKIK